MMADRVDGKLHEYHPTIGLVLLTATSVQAVVGLLQHQLFRTGHRTTILPVAHIWLGRSLITLGMIDGGVGLLFSYQASRSECIAYGVVAAIIWLSYITFSVCVQVRTRKG